MSDPQIVSRFDGGFIGSHEKTDSMGAILFVVCIKGKD